ncbi:hypothetical protein ACFSTD_07570 [Novosphingobium colocasiae]
MASFIWNVWQKFIFPKPRVRVTFMLMRIVGSDPPHRLLTLNFTNFGPGEIVIDCAVARPRTPWYKRRTRLGLLNPIANLAQPDEPTGPYAGGLPKKLAVGEEHILYFPYVAEMFMREPLACIGVHDSFRRTHWAPRGDFRKVVEQHRKDFPILNDNGAPT